MQIFPQMQLRDEHNVCKKCAKICIMPYAVSFNLFSRSSRVCVCVVCTVILMQKSGQQRTPKQQQEQQPQWAVGQTMRILALNRIRIQNLLHLLGCFASLVGSGRSQDVCECAKIAPLLRSAMSEAARPQRDGNCARIMHNDFINGLLCCSFFLLSLNGVANWQRHVGILLRMPLHLHDKGMRSVGMWQKDDTKRKRQDGWRG